MTSLQELRAEDELETDRGPRDGRAGPVRTCIATRTRLPAEEMLRFVVGPDGAVVADLASKLPGRGAWVAARRQAVAAAVAKRAFARAFRTEVRVDPALPDQVERLLETAALAGLSLANKGGAVVAGFTKVEDAIESGTVAALLHACEAATDGVERLDRAFARRAAAQSGTATAVSTAAAASRPAAEPMVLRRFTTEQLNFALGRSNVIHAAVLAGPASGGFLARWKRLDGYRSEVPAVAAGR